MKGKNNIMVFFLVLSARIFAQQAVDTALEIDLLVKGNTQEQRIFVTSQEIDVLKPENTISLLQSLGVTVKSNGGYGTVGGVTLRGFRGKDIIVTVDGVSVNSAMNAEANFNSISVSQIESIEIIKGAFISDATVEGGVGGIINIVTKKQFEGVNAYFDVSAATYFNNPFDRGQLKTGIALANNANLFSFDGSVTYANNAFAYEDMSGKKREMTDARIINGSASLQVSHLFNNGNELLVRNIFYAGDSNINGAVLTAFPFLGYQQDFNNSLLVHFNMPELFNDWGFSSSIQYDSNTQFYDTHGAFASEDAHLLNSLQAMLSAHYSTNDAFEQDFGLHITTDMLDSTQIQESLFFSGFLKSTTAIHIQDNFSILMPLTVTFSERNVSFVPKIGLQYGFSKGTLSLNAYRLHQFPTINDLYFSGGNPSLNSEHGVGGEVVLNMHSMLLPFSLAVFTNYYFDKIQWQADAVGVWKPLNIGKAFYSGFDVLSDQQITNFFSIRTNYQFVMSWLLDNGNTFADNIRVSYAPLHTLGVGGVFHGEKTTLSITGNYVGKRYTDNTNTKSLLPYFLLEIAGDVSINTMIQMYAKISNAFNETYYETEYYPMPGVSATIGVRYNFEDN